MSNSELLRIKNEQKTPYKKQKTASSYENYTLNGLMTDWGLTSISRMPPLGRHTAIGTGYCSLLTQYP